MTGNMAPGTPVPPSQKVQLVAKRVEDGGGIQNRQGRLRDLKRPQYP